MRDTIRPRFSGPFAAQVSREWARIKLGQEIRKRLNWATELVASGQVDVREAVELIRLHTVRTATNGTRWRQMQRGFAIRRLEALDGIGDKLAERLIDRFGSLESIARATIEQLGAVPGVGEKRANIIVTHARELLEPEVYQ